MPGIGAEQGPRQPMLQAYRRVSTIRPKHLDKGHWKDLEIKDLEIEITKIRRVKTEIVPVIVGELAFMSKGMEYNLEKISGAININELQKIILLETYSAHAKKISVHPVKYPSSTSGPRNGPGSSRVQEAVYSTSTV